MLVPRLGTVVAVLSLALVLVAGPGTASARASADSAVVPWMEFELGTIGAERLNPPRASRALAHLSVAMHLAALSGESGRDEAVAGAASVVARFLHPGQAGRIDALVAQLADPGSGAFARGRLVGQLVVVRALRASVVRQYRIAAEGLVTFPGVFPSCTFRR